MGLEPCLDLAHCDEAGDFCLACVNNAECDDAVACTDDLCDAGTCSNTSNCALEETCNLITGICEMIPHCNDGLDNDGDGTIDENGGPGGEPADPGCAGVEDPSEKDDTGYSPATTGSTTTGTGGSTSIW